MIRRLLLPPYLIAEPWLRHSNWMVRRVAQVAVVGIAIIWLALPGARRPEPGRGTDTMSLLGGCGRHRG